MLKTTLLRGENAFRIGFCMDFKNGLVNDNNKAIEKRPDVAPKQTGILWYTISFNEQEHARFLALFDKSGMRVRHFITSCIFDKTIKNRSDW